MNKIKLVAAAIIATAFGVTALGQIIQVEYPSDYRSWQHIKTMVIEPGHPLEVPFGGIHHIYANSKAMKGLETGDYKAGAVFVFDLLSYENINQTIIEGERKRIDVMEYDAERFSNTGGWAYETFIGSSKTERLPQDVVTACHGCHMGAKASNYVFSQYRP